MRINTKEKREQIIISLSYAKKFEVDADINETIVY